MTEMTHMRREIEEIPEAITRLLTKGRADLSKAAYALRAANPTFLVTVARGSSDHAATYLKYACELLIGIPVASVGPSVASVYGATCAADGSACFAISQSGRSPDILAMVQSLAATAVPTIVLCNDNKSPLAQMGSHSVDILAGAEHSIAATKSFVSSVVAGLMILAEWGKDDGLITAINALPTQLAQAALNDWPDLRRQLLAGGPALVLGRGPTFAIAAEAALKLKETCAIHAEAYSTAEVMHGPVEIVDARFTALCFAANDAAMPGVIAAANKLTQVRAASFVTGSSADYASLLPHIRTGHPLTDPLALIVSFYANVEKLSRDMGRNPDRPAALKKVTETS